jgi:membrane-bound lytic murein transglycosylase D
MKNKPLFLVFIMLFFGLFGRAQKAALKANKQLTVKDFVKGETYAIDTVIRGVTYYKKMGAILAKAAPKGLQRKTELNAKLDSAEGFSAVDDSLQPKPLEDLEHARVIDKKWHDELYDNALFDTIYNAVKDLDYQPVDYPELSTDTLKARLKRLNARTPFNVAYNPALESVIKNYLKNRRTSMARLMGVSHYYFPMFEEALDKENIPLEIKYLAIVESALKPRARSKVGATGLWQFMFATGKAYGLNVSSYVDERSDPLKSTNAAAKYLAKLHEIFGDWDLALAAYNSGPGNVSKAIRRSGGYTNYWNIRPHLPRETAGYLPAFLATMYIFEFAKEHDFKPEKPQFQYVETDTVHVKEMITLGQVATVTDVHIEELEYLNPSYKLNIIPYVKGENYTLRMPRSAIGSFVANEEKIYAFAKAELDKREKPLPQFFESKSKIRYKVRSGDYLGKIASKYGVGVNQIKQWNGLRGSNLKVGQRLSLYPRHPSVSVPTSKQEIVSKSMVKALGNKTYRVNSGDSLWSISQNLSGVTMQNLIDWNKISGDKLTIGMTLVVSE